MKGWKAGTRPEEDTAEEQIKWSTLRREIGTEKPPADPVLDAIFKHELKKIYAEHPEWEKKIGPSKEDVIRAAELVAEDLGEAMTWLEFTRRTRITFTQVRDYFGGWSGLREEIGLSHRARPPKKGPSAEEMRDALMDLMAESPNPSWREYQAATGWSQKLVEDRWGMWSLLKRSVGLGMTKRTAGDPSREEMLAAFRGLMEREGGRVTERAFCQSTGWRPQAVRRVWGCFTDLRLAGGGAETRGGRALISEADVLADVGRVAAAVGRFPTCAEYGRLGRYSMATVLSRFAGWRDLRSAHENGPGDA